MAELENDMIFDVRCQNREFLKKSVYQFLYRCLGIPTHLITYMKVASLTANVSSTKTDKKVIRLKNKRKCHLHRVRHTGMTFRSNNFPTDCSIEVIFDFLQPLTNA